MPTKITLLVDNNTQSNLKKEHGFALLIESQGKRILFDNGQKKALFCNADKLNVSLNNIDIIILSHGHYDHGGNLAALFLANPNAIFYAHPDCKKTRYSLHPNTPVKMISLSKTALQAINAIPQARCKMITQPTEILPAIWLTGQIPRTNHYEDTGGPFFLDPAGVHTDYLNDDMSLWIERGTGLTVICGCCHAGISNTIEHIKQHKKTSKPINILLGGLHLIGANQQRLDSTIEYLNGQNIKTIYPAHCTGEPAIKLLTNKYKNTVEIAAAGLTIKLQ